MSMHPEDFPRWLAGVAARPVDAGAHRLAIVRTMNWLVGPDATAAIRARSVRPEVGSEHPPAANAMLMTDRLAA